MINKNIKNIYLEDGMKIGIIGISGKGKTTLLNSLLNEEVSEKLENLIGPEEKEQETSGQTKNPVRYNLRVDLESFHYKVNYIEDEEVLEKDIELDQIERYIKGEDKCTVTISTSPSKEFKTVMEEFGLNELEFIDTQGILDTLNEDDLKVPLEIEECTVILYLYGKKDLTSRGDYIKKYRSFIKGISHKPLIFLETDYQLQVMKPRLKDLLNNPKEELNNLDSAFKVTSEDIMNRYEILTGNDEIDNDTFILSYILSASESSTNFYQVVISNDIENADKYKKIFLRIASAHTLNNILNRLDKLKTSLEKEFQKITGEFRYIEGFKVSYGLLNDVFVKELKRVDGNSFVLSHARHDSNMFKNALKIIHKGKIFEIIAEGEQFRKYNKEIHTEYGYHKRYTTYEDQNILDLMQILYDMYQAYLKEVSYNGDKLSRVFQEYIKSTISSMKTYLTRDTGYEIRVLDEDTFIHVINELKNWVGDLDIERVIYSDYENLDIDYCNKKNILNKSEKGLSSPYINSLITKLVYLTSKINSEIYNLTEEEIFNEIVK